MSRILTVFRRTFDFAGRSQRAEFWSFVAALFVAALVLIFVVGFSYASPGGVTDRAAADRLTGRLLLGLAVVVALPHTALGVRRLHDTGRSGWWLLLSGFPGGIILLAFWLMLDGDRGDNAYGPDPKGRESFAATYLAPDTRIKPAAMPRP